MSNSKSIEHLHQVARPVGSHTSSHKSASAVGDSNIGKRLITVDAENGKDSQWLRIGYQTAKPPKNTGVIDSMDLTPGVTDSSLLKTPEHSIAEKYTDVIVQEAIDAALTCPKCTKAEVEALLFGENCRVPEMMRYTHDLVDGSPDVSDFQTWVEWRKAMRTWKKKRAGKRLRKLFLYVYALVKFKSLYERLRANITLSTTNSRSEHDIFVITVNDNPMCYGCSLGDAREKMSHLASFLQGTYISEYNTYRKVLSPDNIDITGVYRNRILSHECVLERLRVVRVSYSYRVD